jgi:N-acetylmuramoyl-L-alanine amidase
LRLAIIAAIMLFGSAAHAVEEHKCLALNIYFEARGESEEGQMAVAHVTLNRVQSSQFPNTICEVVYQSRQFSWTHTLKSHKPRNAEAWKRAQRIATTALSWHDVGEDFSDGALYFHADYVRPYWADIFEQTVQIGKHIFYR